MPLFILWIIRELASGLVEALRTVGRRARRLFRRCRRIEKPPVACYFCRRRVVDDLEPDDELGWVCIDDDACGQRVAQPDIDFNRRVDAIGRAIGIDRGFKRRDDVERDRAIDFKRHVERDLAIDFRGEPYEIPASGGLFFLPPNMRVEPAKPAHLANRWACVFCGRQSDLVPTYTPGRVKCADRSKCRRR